MSESGSLVEPRTLRPRARRARAALPPWEPVIPDEDAGAPDLIFLDPPYQAVAEDPVRAACRAAALASRLTPGGVLCFHFEEGLLDEDDFDEDLSVELRHWGRTVVALIEAPSRSTLKSRDRSAGRC